MGSRNAVWAGVTLGVVAAVGGFSSAAQDGLYRSAQLKSLDRRGFELTVPSPNEQAPESAASGENPDPSGVWYHVRRQDLRSARTELERLKEEYPSWRVPPDLSAAVSGKPTIDVAADRYQQRVDATVEAIGNGTLLDRSIAGLSELVEARSDSGAAERLGRAFEDAEEFGLAVEWFDRALALAVFGSDQYVAAVYGLVRAHSVLGQWDRATYYAGVLPPDSEGREVVVQIISGAASSAASEAAKTGDWLLAEKLAAIAEINEASQIRTDLGWVALDAGDGVRAASLFEAGPQSEESRYGRILALGEYKADTELFLAACEQPDRSARQSQACGDALAERAASAYESEDWAEVISLDVAARGLGLVRDDMRLISGWSNYRQGNYNAALQAFEETVGSETDAVEGLIQTYMTTGRYDELEARALAGDARFLAMYREKMGELALIRKRSVFASSVLAPNTEGLSEPAITLGAFVRDKTGASGADRLTWQGGAISASTIVGKHKFSLGLEAGHLHVGTPGQGAAIGSLQPSGVVPDAGAVLTMPWGRWDFEEIDRAYSVTIGTTPIGGDVAPLPAIELTAERNWESFIGAISMRATPRMDSLLAMSGRQDAATRATWGRVVEVGPEVRAIALLNQNLSISVNAEVNLLRGHRVADNTHVGTSASLTYELKPSGFDYVRVGPSYGFDHYAHNANFFTIGHGGYYSPKASHNLGAFIDFLTLEGGKWVVAGRVTAAWQYSVEAPAARFPLDDDGTRFQGITQSQFGTDSMVRSAVLLGPNLVLGGYARVSHAPSGRDFAAGLTLTIPFGARTGVSSSDLPHFSDRSWP